MAGRGFGKTRIGAEWVRARAESDPTARIAIVSPTAKEVRDVCIEGESGILAICPPWNRPEWNPSRARLVWPNGAQAFGYTAEKPDRLRGPQHTDAWGDELRNWPRPESFSNLLFGLRLGRDPRLVLTTTPNPMQILRDLIKDPTCVVTGGRTLDNIANLSPSAVQDLLTQYEGTRLGRAELEGELLEESEGSLWKRWQIDRAHVQDAPELQRTVVAIDPASTSNKNSDETGIIVAAKGVNGRGYVLEDLSGRYSPDGWARKAIDAYHRHGANRIVAESNQGGEMIRTVISSVERNLPVKLVHASKGKQARAEPIHALYEQDRISHVGTHSQLEDQLCTWEPLTGDASPDRLDAMVWALTHLFPPRGISFAEANAA